MWSTTVHTELPTISQTKSLHKTSCTHSKTAVPRLQNGRTLILHYQFQIYGQMASTLAIDGGTVQKRQHQWFAVQAPLQLPLLWQRWLDRVATGCATTISSQLFTLIIPALSHQQALLHLAWECLPVPLYQKELGSRKGRSKQDWQ